MLRETRRIAIEFRPRAALIPELQGIERLSKATPDDSPYRAALTRRLAEGYVELEHSAMSELLPQPAPQNEATMRIVNAAHFKVVQNYLRLMKEHPSYPKLDEVLYFLGVEHERNGEDEKARATFLELLDKAPKSHYVERAHLALGEIFFRAAQHEPSNWGLARAEYEQAAKSLPPANTLYGHTHYRLAQVFRSMGKSANALGEFKKVIEYVVRFPDALFVTTLATGARGAMIPLFAEAGKPAGAFNYFKSLSGDSPGSVDRTVGMLVELAAALVSANHADGAVTVYLDLMKQVRPDQDARICSLPPAALVSAVSGAPKYRELELRKSQLCH